MSAQHILERLDGLQVLGWAVAVDPRLPAEVTLLVGGRQVAVEVRRHAREDVAMGLGVSADVLYGYSIDLSSAIWDSSGQLQPVQVSAAGITLDLPQGPDILGAIGSSLSRPPSSKEIGTLPPLLAHLNAMAATPQVCATRQRLLPLLSALGWSLEGPWHIPEDVRGHVDRFDELRVEGWVNDVSASPCRFSLWHSGRIWDVHTHRVLRPDLNNGELPSGFVLDIPPTIWADLPQLRSEVKVLANGQALSGATLMLDTSVIDARVRSSFGTSEPSLATRAIAEQLLELRWLNHALALHGQGRLSASAIICLINWGVSEGLFVAPLLSGQITPVQEAPLHEDSALWRSLKSLNLDLDSPSPPSECIDRAIAAAPPEIQQRLLLAIAPWSCVNDLFHFVFPKITESTWLSLSSEHSLWADSVVLPWLLLSNRMDSAVQVCERLAKGTSGWLNTECLRWSMEALCGLRPHELSPDPAWGVVRHALLGAVLSAGSNGERLHDHHLLVSLWTWLAHLDADDSFVSLTDVHKVLAHQGLNPGFWAERQRQSLKINQEVSALLDEVHEGVSPLLHAPPSQWSEIPPSTRAIIDRWCDQSGSAGREVRRIVRDWACHLSIWHEPTSGHSIVAEWLQRLGPSEALRWRQSPLIISAPLISPHPDALVQAYQLPRLHNSRALTSVPESALRVVWIPEQIPAEAPDSAPDFGRSDINADWTVWAVACVHASPCLPPFRADQSLAMRWLRAIAWFVECTDQQAVCVLPWSGKVHVPTLLQLVKDAPPPYCGPNHHWLRSQRSPNALAWDTQISFASATWNGPAGTPTGCLLTRATAKDLIDSCAALLSQDLMTACSHPDQLIQLLLAELGVRPHALSHTWLQPLVAEQRYAWDTNRLLPSLTLWPSDSPPIGPSANSARSLRLISPPQNLQRFGCSDVVVVCVVRNEVVMLPHFLRHYRRLGINHFVFIDNLSIDGTTAMLLAQPDAIVYSAEADYRVARYGVTWQLTAMAHHAMGKWVIAVDADELLFVPGIQDGKILEWLQEIDRSGCTAVQTPMVDMLPEGALSEAKLDERTPFEVAPYFDTPAVLPWHLGSGQFSNQRTYVSGLRHRLVPSSPPNAFTSQKVPIFRYQPWIHFADGLHYASNVALSKKSAWLAHFKYHSGFGVKVQEEVVRQQHFAHAAEYQTYARMIKETGGIFRSPLSSSRFECIHPLANLDETV